MRFYTYCEKTEKRFDSMIGKGLWIMSFLAILTSCLSSESPDLSSNNEPRGLPLSGNVAVGFGETVNVPGRDPFAHDGMDISVPIGTGVYSTLGGRVIDIGYEADGRGNYIIVGNHEFEALFAKLESLSLQVGDSVSPGDFLGLSGNSGFSLGPHLHYEVRYHGILVDPADYL